MIIFYNKKTGEILGHIDGRVHSDEVLEKVSIEPEGMDPDDIGKYVVPVAEVKEVVETPTVEYIPDGPGSARFVRHEAVRKELKTVELRPAGPLGKLALDVENAKKSVLDHKLTLNQRGEVSGFTERDDVPA